MRRLSLIAVLSLAVVGGGSGCASGGLDDADAGGTAAGGADAAGGSGGVGGLPPGAGPPGGCSGSDETCNGLDDDCDGITDEGLVRSCGAAVGVCEAGVERCDIGRWTACTGVGGAEETCEDPTDEDCDGTADEGCACADGESRPCGVDVGRCLPGQQLCEGGLWSACVGALLPSPETCDGTDDDCDGTTDEGLERPCGTGAGVCVEGVSRCAGGEWAACEGAVEPGEERCDAAEDEDCDGLADEGCACRDGDARPCGPAEGACQPGTQRCAAGAWGGCEGAVGPTPEQCGGAADEDCDGAVDEGCDCDEGAARPCGPAVGACRPGAERCTGGRWGACEGATGPGREACDGAVDEDCDGEVDEGCACVEDDRRPCGSSVGACEAGAERCSGGAWGACEGAVRPSDEVCDGAVDEDCDGDTDEGCECVQGASRPCGADVGRCEAGMQQCANGTWGGCEGAVEPQNEACDGSWDDDCDGNVDEGCACVDGTERPCGMATGRCERGAQRCVGGDWGGCEGAVDPVDEVCDGTEDDDCDGDVDEGCACVNGEVRPCGAAVGECRAGEERCADGAWGACEGAVEPGAEVCEGRRDEDCDGTIDEGFRAATFETTYADLAASHPECDGETQRYGVNCTSAVHRLCNNGCQNAGFGPVENSGGDATGLCVRSAQTDQVPWARMNMGQFQLCTAENPNLFLCMLAADTYCREEGFVAGFGPVEFDRNGAFVVCVAEGQATRRQTSWEELSREQPLCDGMQQLFGSECTSAMNRICRADGAVGGFGPIQFVDGGPVALCLLR